MFKGHPLMSAVACYSTLHSQGKKTRCAYVIWLRHRGHSLHMAEQSAQHTTWPQGQKAVATSLSMQIWQIRASWRCRTMIFSFSGDIFSVLSLSARALLPSLPFEIWHLRCESGDWTGRYSAAVPPERKFPEAELTTSITRHELSSPHAWLYAWRRVRCTSNRKILPNSFRGTNTDNRRPARVLVHWSMTDRLTVLHW